jgi:hypothetical protein
MKIPASLAVLPLLSWLAVSPAQADDVYLVNGRVFEDVIAQVTDSHVRIRTADGTVSLPKEQVSKVVESESALAELLRRKETLRRAPEIRAADWLDLATWARTRGLERPAREAALTAAGIDPHLAGLEPLMRGLGYVFDAELDRWISYGDSMRRRGFVFSNGQWISRDEHQQNVRAREESLARQREAQRAAEQARAERRTETALQAAELALAREAVQASKPEKPALRGYDLFGGPLLLMPGWYVPLTPPGPGTGPNPPTEPRGPVGPRKRNDQFSYVPGSLLPGPLGSGY